MRCEQRVVLALDGPIPPIVEDVSHHLLNMNGVFVIEARLDGIVHIVLREIGYLVPDLLLGPIRVLLFIEAGQVLLLHRLLVDGRFEIDLETQNVRICNGLANGVRMQQLAEDFLRAKTSGGFVEHGSAGVPEPRCAFERLLDRPERVSPSRAMGLVDYEYDVLVGRFERFALDQLF